MESRYSGPGSTLRISKIETAVEIDSKCRWNVRQKANQNGGRDLFGCAGHRASFINFSMGFSSILFTKIDQNVDLITTDMIN